MESEMGSALRQRNGGQAESRPVIEVSGLTKHYPVKKGLLRRTVGQVFAVDGVSFAIGRGETLGLIGESGSGKSSLARTVLRLETPSAGRIIFDGTDITHVPEASLRPLRRRMQVVFQDPYASLNPRKTVEDLVSLPLRVHAGLNRRPMRDEVVRMIEAVGLRAAHLSRFPHQFSGGQRQRIAIARALVLRPDFVVCDEPVSALDVSVQAQIIALLQRLKRELGLTYLFISHDLAVIGSVSERVAVMYLGSIVETGPTRQILARPQHPYTAALLAAVLRIDPGAPRRRVKPLGEPPSPLTPPPGCRFHPRCPLAVDRCRSERPALRPVGAGVLAACHLAPFP
jgi:oligopeptide/dipeptide ABC transporter ATP-binding protein